MAGLAVIGDLSFFVTVHTKPHRVIHNAFGDGHRCHVAVAVGAVYLSANVRSVIESHMRFVIPSVNALPGNVFAAIVVRLDLLDFRTIDCRGGVAAPACPDVRYACSWTPVHGNMTVDTQELLTLHVRVMRERDRLDSGAAHTKEMPRRLAYRDVTGRKGFRRGIVRRGS